MASDLQQFGQRAHTKIVATLGPASREPEMLAALIMAGADVFRINMAHGSRSDHEAAVAAVRDVGKRLGQPVAILVDLAGPKIRLGELPGGQIDCQRGQRLKFVRGQAAQAPDELVTTYDKLVDELEVGKTVMLADGAVGIKIEEKTPDAAVGRVVQAGIIRSRQGLNLPGMKLSAPAMDEDDRENVEWAHGAGVDYLGLSFVRSTSDVHELKQLLAGRRSKMRVVAKIEKQEALDELEAIVDAADAVMVARGDLGVEIDVARMPVVQKHIVAVCQERQKPVIIATQMLESMHNSRVPTRAEVTDVANAILDGGDACMLSGETAVGKYPREAVEMMNQIALETEQLFRDRPAAAASRLRAEGLHLVTHAVTYGAAHIAKKLGAAMIAVVSHSGATALAVAKQRNFVPTVGVSDSEQTLWHMCLYWGVVPLPDAPSNDTAMLLDYLEDWGLDDGCLKLGDYLVLVAGSAVWSSHDMVLVHEVSGRRALGNRPQAKR